MHISEQLTAMEDGTHRCPVRAEIRRAIGKGAGASATIRLEERVDG